MDFKSLYTSYDGRIGRQKFWIGVIILIVAAIIVGAIVNAILGVNMFGYPEIGSTDPNDYMDLIMGLAQKAAWANIITFVIFVVPWSALMIKRAHDRDSNGMLVWVAIGISAITLLMQAFGFYYTMMDMGGGMMIPTPNVVGWVLGLVSFIIGVYLLVVLGFLKGTQGPNSYGEDPLA